MKHILPILAVFALSACAAPQHVAKTDAPLDPESCRHLARLGHAGMSYVVVAGQGPVPYFTVAQRKRITTMAEQCARDRSEGEAWPYNVDKIGYDAPPAPFHNLVTFQ